MAVPNVQLTGVAELRQALIQAGSLAQEALAAAMVEEAEAVITAAKQQTPVDTGTLRGSGTVLPPETSMTKVSVTLGFGGAAAGYVVPVHEGMGASHPVGNAKFLERPLMERAPKIPSNLAARVLAAWQRLRK